MDPLLPLKSVGEGDLENEYINVKIENERCKEKIQELEKWLILLLNNFYEGNPHSLKNIEQVIKAHQPIGVEKNRRIERGEVCTQEALTL